MTWLRDGENAVIQCDHEGCAERVKHPIESDDHVAAAELAVKRGWHVPNDAGLHDAPARDYCAAHRPASTVLHGVTVDEAAEAKRALDRVAKAHPPAARKRARKAAKRGAL